MKPSSLLLFLLVADLQAATLTWDANNATTLPQDGAGTWDTSQNNWWNGSANPLFTPGDNVVFGATSANAAYTITLASSTSVGSLTFSNTNTFPRYTIDLGTNTLTVNGQLSLNAQAYDYGTAFSNGTLQTRMSGSSAANPDIYFDPNDGIDYGVVLASAVDFGSGNRYILGTPQRNDVARYSGDLRFNGALTGTASLYLAGTTTDNSHNVHYVLNGSSPGFTGNIILNGNADLALTNNSALTSANNVTFDPGSARAALFLFGHSVTIGNLNDPNILGTRWIHNGSLDSSNGGTNSNTSGSSIALGLRTPANLTITQTVDGTFGGSISDGLNDTGTGVPGSYFPLGITKNGNATLTLSGICSHSGPTIVNAGSLCVNGTSNFSHISIANGARLTGTGNTNEVDMSNGSILSPGIASIGTLTTGPLVIGFSPSDTGTINVALGANPAILKVYGGVTTTGTANTVTINLNGEAPPVGQYPVIDYVAGNIGGTGISAFKLGNLPNRVSATLVENTFNTSIDIRINGMDFPVWTGAQSSEWSNATIAGSKNWTMASDSSLTTDFAANDTVQFDDDAITTTVDISSTDVAPGSVRFVNNWKNFLLTGSKGIVDGNSQPALSMNGSGTLTIANTNSFTGPVFFNGGTISTTTLTNSGIPGPLGAGTSLNFGGGTLSYTGSSFAINRSLNALSGNSSIHISNPATTLTLGGILSGSANLTLGGAGKCSITGYSVMTGTLAIESGGICELASGGNLGSTGITNNGTLTLRSGSLPYTGNMTIGSGAALVVDRTDASALSGNLSGAGSLLIQNTGMPTLAGTNTYLGGTTLAGPDLSVSNGSALGSGTLHWNIPSTLAIANTAAVTLPNNITLADSGTYTILKSSVSTTGGTLTELSGLIGGGGAGATLYLNTNASGDYSTTFRLSAASTYRATIFLNRGCIEIANAAALGDPGNQLNMASNSNNTLGTLRFGTALTVANPILFATPVQANTNGYDVALSGVLSGGGTAWLSKLGGGALILAGNNTFAGTVTLSGGSLQVGNGGTSGTLGSGSITNNATLAFCRSDAITVANAISGTGGIVQKGTGTTTLTGTVGASSLTVNSGTLALNGSLSNPPALYLNSGTLALGNGISNIGSQTVAALTQARARSRWISTARPRTA